MSSITQQTTINALVGKTIAPQKIHPKISFHNSISIVKNESHLFHNKQGTKTMNTNATEKAQFSFHITFNCQKFCHVQLSMVDNDVPFI
jgi:hypothetical protein